MLPIPRSFSVARSLQAERTQVGAELTWIAILASVFMGLGGVCIFVYATKKDYFKDFEDAKYQVFWSDLAESVDGIEQEETPSGSTADGGAARRP